MATQTTNFRNANDTAVLFQDEIATGDEVELELECISMWTKVLIGVVSVMAFVGVLLNSCAIRAILQRVRRNGLKMPIDCYMLALFIEDIIYNIVATIPNLKAEWDVGVMKKEMSVLAQRFVSMFCCLANVTTTMLLLLIAIDRFIAVFQPMYKGRTVKKALAQLVALLFFMVGFGTTIWFQSWLFSMVFVVPVADLVLYGAILYKVHSQLKRSGKNSDGLTLRELFLAKSMALTGLVSVISTSPCIYAFAMFYFPPFYQWRLAKTQSCYRFPLLSMVHLPLANINYFIHPILFYATSPKFQEDIHRAFGFKKDKPNGTLDATPPANTTSNVTSMPQTMPLKLSQTSDGNSTTAPRGQ